MRDIKNEEIIKKSAFYINLPDFIIPSFSETIIIKHILQNKCLIKK